MSPYQGALDHIERHPGTSGALGLAKLVLSLWNGDDCGFSFRECIQSLDDDRMVIALGCVLWFADHREDAELVRIGHRVHELYPRLWQLGIAAAGAKRVQQQLWDQEWERTIEAEEREGSERRDVHDEDCSCPECNPHPSEVL